MKRINFKGIIDTTLRDGQESPVLFDTYKYRFNLNDKKQLLDGLIKLGIRYFELFCPVVSQAEKKDFLELKKFALTLTNDKIYFFAHCRSHDIDINQSLDVGFDGLNLYLGLSKLAQKYSHKHNFQEILDLTKNLISSLRKNNPDLYIRFSGEDAFRTPLKDTFQVYDQIYQYVDTFGIPDTVGTATPREVSQRIKVLKKRYPKVNLECHFHNDRGLSLINAITAIEEGAEFVDCSVWGLAERSGITSITALLLNLYKIDKKLCKNYNIDLCYPINVLMGTILGIQVPYTEPVSLTNRTHTAGVHQKAVLNKKDVYEGHNLEIFGVNKNQMFLGPLSGWNLIYYYLKEIKGFVITKDQTKEIAKEFKECVDQINKSLSPEELLLQIADKYKLTKIRIPDRYVKKRLENLS